MNKITQVMIAALVVSVVGCGKLSEKAARLTGGGDSELGKQEIEYYGCASCHDIPGTDGAQGLIGPSLKHFASRNYIGGVLENSSDNLIRWIQDAPAVNPKTAMPDLHLPDGEARNIASYLNTLQ